jgi:polyisoprenoid-binding protein YceI
VGDFTGTTRTLTGRMTGGADLTAVRGWVEAPVATLRTGDRRRDKDLNKSMETAKYPTMRFDLTGVVPRERRGDTATVLLRGRFTIHGITRDATVPATVVVRPGDIRVRGVTPLNLKDYKIGGLTRAFGMLKMFEEIVVRVDVTFAPQPLGSA